MIYTKANHRPSSDKEAMFMGKHKPKPGRVERDKLMIDLYGQGHSMNEVAKMVGVSKGTVHNAIKRSDVDSTTLKIRHLERTKKYAEQLTTANEEQTGDMLGFIQSKGITEVCRLAISKLTSKNMDYDIQKNGIGNMYRIIGMFADKVLSARDYEIKLRGMAIREKELAIKEKELELRITNPEAFRDVTIINDAPKHGEAYERSAD